MSYYECPHGNLPSERCARCVADGRRQPGDHNARRYTDPDRIDKQTKADDALAKRAVRQGDERARVAGIRQAAAWSRQQAGLYQPDSDGDGEPGLMGSRNVTAALMYWHDLDPWARVLLCHMAVISLDHDRGEHQARLYYGGRRAMAEALYGRLPSEDATDYQSVTMLRNRYSTTSRTLHRLVAAGAVKLVRGQSPGHPREWLLILGTDDAADTSTDDAAVADR